MKVDGFAPSGRIFLRPAPSRAPPWVLIFGRGDKRVFYWTDMDYIDQRKRTSKSILKKEFMTMTNFVRIKKNLIDFSSILENEI